MSRLGDVCVLGLGESGEAVAAYCAERLGIGCDSITVVDSSDSPSVAARSARLEALGVRVLLGRESVPGCFDLCVASPGIPPHAPLMRSAGSGCTEVISEIEFAFRVSRCAWVAVTGTNGKTTTTALTAHLLNESAISARAVGNIGVPAITAVAQGCVDELLVAEVSSFQLALTTSFRPRVAVLLNLTPDHLDWHGSMEEYAADKARVFANMGRDDLAIIDVDDPGSAPYADALEHSGVGVARISLAQMHMPGGSVRDGRLVIGGQGIEHDLGPVDGLRITGPHNVSNALAAACAAHAMGAPIAGLGEALRSFRPIEHRLEPLDLPGDLEWFNDSKATNPDAVLKAVSAFEGRPYVLLLGGRNKGNRFDQLATATALTARSVVVFGEAAAEIADAFAGTGLTPTIASTLQQATRRAYEVAMPGDAIVLSPACASFDEFGNYEERGRAFKDLAAALAGGGDW